jgi:hypothetical protein
MELEPVNTRIQETVPEELYHKLVAQIEKDFILTGIKYDFNNLKPTELIVCLNEIMEELLNKEYPVLLSLLYRMDIPESAINFGEEETVELQLVNLILRRQFMKVKMRMKYS